VRRVAIDGWRCERGHVHLHAHDGCPECGRRLFPARVAPEATLLVMTTVRVTPTGEPFRLGVAVTRAGHARTLCRVAGRLRENGRDAVVLERRGDAIVARARPRSRR
jgi:uncharacterized OB-fold protein